MVNGEVVVSLITNDWKLINDGHEKSMDSSNPADCFPKMVPVITKKCFKVAN